MNYPYADITMFNDANTTTAYHYKNQLRLGDEFVHLIAHPSPWAHTFFCANDQPGDGSVFSFEIPGLTPNACFYFLNACMCFRFTEKDNLTTWYLFAQPWGLIVMASTQLMYGIKYLSTIYRALGRDSSFGDAFLKWHRSTYTVGRNNYSSVFWTSPRNGRWCLQGRRYENGRQPIFNKVKFFAPTDFHLEIYSPTGKKLAKLSSQNQTATWSKNRLLTGVYYLVKIKGEDFLTTPKIGAID